MMADNNPVSEPVNETDCFSAGAIVRTLTLTLLVVASASEGYLAEYRWKLGRSLARDCASNVRNAVSAAVNPDYAVFCDDPE
jgi:hypothetical protein